MVDEVTDTSGAPTLSTEKAMAMFGFAAGMAAREPATIGAMVDFGTRSGPMPTTEFGSAVATRPRPPRPDLLETVRGNRNTGFERDEHGHADICAQSTKREQRTVSADAGTAMGGRMCVGRSVFAVRLRTPSPTLLRAFCRWRSRDTPSPQRFGLIGSRRSYPTLAR